MASERTDWPHARDAQEKKREVYSYNHVGPHPSFLRGCVWEHMRPLIWGAYGVWGTVYTHDHVERIWLSVVSAADWTSRPGP
jgi:hypothetical protein